MHPFQELLLQCLWFYLPISIANQSPGFAKKFGLPGNTPVWEKGLGANKTTLAFYSGPIGATVALYAQSIWFQTTNNRLGLFEYNLSTLWILGILIGLGAVLGDMTKSYFKRKTGRPPGKSFWPWDQLDHLLGSVFFALPMTGWIGWNHFGLLIPLVLLIHPIGNTIGWLTGFRKTIT